ncbi:unnamed protein product [Agarophyton chilense]
MSKGVAVFVEYPTGPSIPTLFNYARNSAISANGILRIGSYPGRNAVPDLDWDIWFSTRCSKWTEFYTSRVGGYFPIPQYWHEIKSPRGCPLELLPSITYQGRGRPRRDYSPGRTCLGSDFVWYNPWTNQHIDGDHAKVLQETPRAMPPTQPTGYVHKPTPHNADALVEEMQEIDYDEEPEDLILEDPALGENNAIEPMVLAAMQSSVPEPVRPAVASYDAELGNLKQVPEDARIPPHPVQGN